MHSLMKRFQLIPGKGGLNYRKKYQYLLQEKSNKKDIC